MIIDIIHKKICENQTQVRAWYEKQKTGAQFPFYSSFDIRSSDQKIAPVDANLYPAGFNNICPQDKKHAPEVAAAFLKHAYPNLKGPIVLLTEEHTKNAFYWDNVYTIHELVRAAGYDIRAALPQLGAQPATMTSASGKTVQLQTLTRKGNEVYIDGQKAELVISNNDFSQVYEEITKGLSTTINPSFDLGWHQRKKSQFFHHYNELALQFCEIIKIDPWHLTIATESFSPFEVENEENRNDLAKAVDAMLLEIQKRFVEHNDADKPFVYVKNNSGTYGLGVIKVSSGDDIRNWTYKARKKMKAAKGGGGIKEVIIQEGVPTNIRSEEGETAEPCIYVIGGDLAGGFLRSHQQKDETESLNSPGAVYRKLCVSDLKVNLSGCTMENVYGWVARLSALATAQEMARRSL